MKRIFSILCLALVLFSACKKDKEKGAKFSIDDLMGLWACTEHFGMDGNESPYTAQNTSFQCNVNELIHFAPYYGDGSWTYKNLKFDGDKLILDEGEEWEMKLQIIKLDGKHLTWHQLYEDDIVKESYLNIPKILPGTWKFSWLNAWYIVTIDESGASVWKKNGTADAGSYDMNVIILEDKIAIAFGDYNSSNPSGWYDILTLTSVSEDRLEATNKDNGPVIIERQ